MLAHGGRVTVLPNQPTGAVFRLEFPSHGAPPERRIQRRSHRPRRGAKARSLPRS
jgi:hypothetical protein